MLWQILPFFPLQFVYLILLSKQIFLLKTFDIHLDLNLELFQYRFDEQQVKLFLQLVQDQIIEIFHMDHYVLF